MIVSMTGFGKSICELEAKKITLEIKSLNSKQLDIFTKIPSRYKEKDLEIRKKISTTLTRGKIEFSFYVESKAVESKSKINKEVVKDYYSQIADIAAELGISVSEAIIESILRLPESFSANFEETTDTEWEKISNSIDEALSELNNFRNQEGLALGKDIESRIKIISNKIPEIELLEPQRIGNIKSKLESSLQEFIEKKSFDQNRFEQELIYYLEKIDITEEKIRLQNHCDYFFQTIKENGMNGKKLNFISQEIGREINTIGSKANFSQIQKIVIQMKDELEKVKEQLLNVL
ncbi:MAG: YicC family protein [Bacteroidetes bacterium]|nr:YicC family protein [Bacteroidota bacterium]MBT6687038.1 YicC family protein [Bacteroidota bacterium]MBT7145116.1 YicC family protein [Bacteroidota bacterium]MBT7492557.1 YicC family protein [Bacteroidota bacterium]